MKVYTTTEFDGHWPVGSAAVIVAPTKKKAAILLKAALKDRGLGKETVEELMSGLVLVSLIETKAIILCDGNY